MNPEELFAAVHRRPFVPFRLHVSDGSSYDVRHPDSILVTRRSAILALAGNPDEVPERAITIALLHITRLEDLDAATVRGNGQ
jgi:hypothetical protein